MNEGRSQYNPKLEERLSVEESFILMGFEPKENVDFLTDVEFGDRIDHILELDQEDKIPGL